jgi:2-polyprenyl-6-methoxyphenol hydroxylase-like FAD-dependent oxidoreductase
VKALIAGAGIGGLTSALFLHRAGIAVDIFERADEVRELGVGINMLPHAVKELAELGLMADLDAEGIRTRELIYANRFGQVVWQELRGVEAGYEVPQVSIHRGRLLGIIHRAVMSRLSPGAVRTGCRVIGFEQSRNGVILSFQRGDGSVERAGGDLLVGADGIHSAIRAALYPKEGRPIWNGIMLWRGAAHWPVWRDGRTMAIAGGNFGKFVYYPIGADPVRPDMRLTNWAVMARTGEHRASPPRREDWSRTGILDEVLRLVRDKFELDFVEPAALIGATDPFYEYPCCDREPLPRWSFGRVTLLGDAAHPMYPVGSNGASQAILDAKCLAFHLASAGTVEEALAAYDAERRPPTSQIVLANRKGGPEGVIDMVEARAPDGFDDIDEVASREEREAVVRGYASMAGFSREQVNRRAG